MNQHCQKHELDHRPRRHCNGKADGRMKRSLARDRCRNQPWKAVGGEEIFTSSPPSGRVNLPTYGKFEFTDAKVAFTLVPRPFNTKIATTAISAKISAYSTKLWPFRDFIPRYIFRSVLFISFTSSSVLFFCCSTTRRTYTFVGECMCSLRAMFVKGPTYRRNRHPITHRTRYPVNICLTSRIFIHLFFR